jgi:hypothetical protein
MVKFKSWKDAYLFLKEYGNFSCLNCKGSNHNLDTDIEHTDTEYARFFCSTTVAMVRLDYQFYCRYWRHKDTGESIEDLVSKGCEHTWNLPRDVIDFIEDEGNKRLWSVDEIRGLIENYEH